MRPGRRPIAPIALAVLLAAAGCERDEADDGDIFMRSVPEGEFPIRPAPDVADIRPVPDLDYDRRALAMVCAAAGWMDGEACGCVARGAADRFSGRRLAWFAARLMDDEAEQAQLERLLPQTTREELAATYASVVENCAR